MWGPLARAEAAFKKPSAQVVRESAKGGRSPTLMALAKAMDLYIHPDGGAAC